MSFQVKKTIYKLTFANPEYEGLTVRVRSPSMGVFLDIASLVDLDVEKVGVDDLGQVEHLFKHFIDSLVEWNLEDEDTGDPIPGTIEGLKTLDLDFALDMITAWMGAMKGVTPGLQRPSGSGQPSQEASIPMEALSPSLPS